MDIGEFKDLRMSIMNVTLKEMKEKNYLGSYVNSINALYVLQDAIESASVTNSEEFANDFNKLGRELIKWQPNQVAIRNRVITVVYYLKRLVKANKSSQEIKKLAIDKIKELIEETEDKKNKIANFGSRLIQNNNRVMTIGISSNIKEILVNAHQQKRKFEVYCLESRPSFEGRLLAEQLAKKGITSYVITDASMAWFAKEVNLIMTGADRIFEKAFVNKMGTLSLALAAHAFQIPFYIAFETHKILKEIDNAVRFYPQNSNDVYISKNKILQAINYQFESIPLEYIAKVVTEEGIYDTVEFANWYLEG